MVKPLRHLKENNTTFSDAKRLNCHPILPVTAVVFQKKIHSSQQTTVLDYSMIISLYNV